MVCLAAAEMHASPGLEEMAFEVHACQNSEASVFQPFAVQTNVTFNKKQPLQANQNHDRARGCSRTSKHNPDS